jgi:hypothetical protein
MYEIILKTWYQETPDKRYDVVYNNLGFEYMGEAVKYLSDNLEKILDEFPVDGELTIKYNQERSLN